jgi:hypothetical protein
MMKNFLILFLFGFTIMQGCKDSIEAKKPADNSNPLDTITQFNGILIHQTGKLTFQINHHFDGEPIVYNTKNYVISSGDAINIERFRYYISNITLVEPTGQSYNLKNYHLVNPKESKNTSFTVNNVKPGIYNRIKFLIGIDSIANTTGVGTGDLDPANGMFWDWNTGYIFYQVEGRTPDNTAYALHLGGTSNVVEVAFELGSYKIKTTEPKFNLKLNYAETFKNPYTYNFSTDPMQMHTPTSPAALLIKANIANIFSLEDVLK